MIALTSFTEARKSLFIASPVMQTTKMQSVSSWLLSLGLVFSVATQLRLPGLPLGLGEILLLLWLLTTLVLPSNWRSQVMMGVLALIIVGALLLSVGYFLTTYPERQTRPPALHDALAYFFCIVLAINFTRLADKYKEGLPVKLLWAFLLNTLLALLLGAATKNWSGMDVMYYHTRWQHLSNNPNQFALLALPLPFFSLYLILRDSKKNIFIPTLLGLLALGLGWYSQSDALTLAWIGGGLVAAFALYRVDSQQSMSPLHLTRDRLFAALLVLLMVIGSAWQWRDVATQIFLVMGTRTEASSNLIRSPQEPTNADQTMGTRTGACSNLIISPQGPTNADQTQVGVRFCLWRNALAVIQYAPLTGMGPGAHSGLTKPFDREEAHNTLLDWGTQTGLIGAAALAGYLTWLLWQVVRRRYYELAAMLLALYSFAIFHFMLRQPLFWIVPLLALQLALRSGASRHDATLKRCAD